MPAEGYLGVNVFEEDESFISSGHKEFYIQEIAMLLAGRISEKKYSKAISSAASNDLQLEELKLLVEKLLEKGILSSYDYFMKRDLFGSKIDNL